MKRILLLAIALIVYGSLYPWHFDLTRGAGIAPWLLLHPWPEHIDHFIARDIALNILLYVPIGMAAFAVTAHAAPKILALAAALLLSLALSGSMEMLQVYVPGRDPSVADVACNFAGGAVGALAALLLHPAFEEWLAGLTARPSAGLVLLLALWAVRQWYPFFPVLGRYRLHAVLAAFARTPLSPLEALATTAEWFVAGLAIRAIFGSLRSWGMAAGLALLAGRFLIATRTLVPGEAVGAAIAALLWIALPDGMRPRAGLALVAAAVVAGELAPFRFSAAATPFSWVPFQATFGADRTPAVLALAHKALLYGAAVWLLPRRSGASPLAASLAVAAALFAFEWLQRHLPGRTPEITDSVVALLMGLVFGWSQTGRKSHIAPARQ